jgi:hypothetical protein
MVLFLPLLLAGLVLTVVVIPLLVVLNLQAKRKSIHPSPLCKENPPANARSGQHGRDEGGTPHGQA